MSFLKISNLSVDYKMRKETVYAAKNINIEVNKGEILGLVGESGSGKSTIANAVINLIDEPGKISTGTIKLGDLDINKDTNKILNYRGKKISGIVRNESGWNSAYVAGKIIEKIGPILAINKNDFYDNHVVKKSD